ncbi:MAG: glycosyltransferase family 2 protein [Candidatus Aminicenantes bacterium]|nr:MAG: glycosyltransferase family 2 protein [Candidatus Aminicenantes bacterium]
MDISIVIPVYNEEKNLPELYKRLFRIIKRLKKSCEIIFVDDGSTDESFEILKKTNRRNENVKVIKFSRNFGHHIAISAGLDHSRGNAVVLMDGDLQDPPEEIPKLYEKYKEGYDIVYAVRKTRKDPFLKKAVSKFFHLIFRLLGKIETPPESGIFRIMSRQSVEALQSCRERSRFITALINWTGFSHIGVETRRESRYAGRSKYNLFKSLRLAMDGFMSFSFFPLRIATYIGFFVALISFTMMIYMLIKKLFFGIPILGYVSIIISVLFIGGVQLLIIGIMGEYIGRIYTEVKSRPMYIIKEKLGIK